MTTYADQSGMQVEDWLDIVLMLALNNNLPAAFEGNAPFFLVHGALADSTVASLLKMYQDDVELTVAASSAWTKRKQVRMIRAGVVRVSMTLRDPLTSSLTHGRVYVNGVATGDEHSTSAASETFTDDITVVVGDTVEIWTKESLGGNDGFLNTWKVESSEAIGVAPSPF